jgi:hypothetical protein
MKRTLLLIAVFVFVGTGAYYAASFIPSGGAWFATRNSNNNEIQRLQSFANTAKLFAVENGYNTQFCFLLDMRLPSGQKRFFVYNLTQNNIKYAGLVAHGSCNTAFLANAQFSNQPGCGCSAKGKYKIGYKYAGRFGTAYKLYGLDSTNSNAYDRYIVLHSYYMVPDKETDSLPICNSLGCAMVSKNFIQQLAVDIDASKKPVLLWILE